MAAMITTWEQTGMFEPGNPNQRTYIYPTWRADGNGAYNSFYYNKVPTTAKLQGVLDSLPDAVGAVVVGLIGLGIGFFGMRAVGPRLRRARR